ncbi:tyrosine-type recombinase/integrase [Priestia filamentosa]|uniref:tyrosine-type recombinase/integrase n=1 Tax=Priestia filamentosa TaxID=1402861 RepID=UPI003981AA2F
MAKVKGAMQPIRDLHTLKEMKEWLIRNKSYKYYMMFQVGINTGLRVSDLLNLKVRDIKGKDRIRIIMKKTKKEVTVRINVDLQRELLEYIRGKKDTDYLFPSRVGVNQPLTRQAVSLVLKEAAEFCQLDRINTHTMRKTFGYWFYKRTKDVYYLMMIFGHENQGITKRYIGIEEDEIMDSMEGFSL